MAKNIKVLLVAFTTFREVAGAKKRVRFSAKQTVELTADEIETLDALTKSTGKLHYRDPVNESVARAEDPELVGDEDLDLVPLKDRTVAQLKAFLDAREVEYPASANKAALLELAEGLVQADADNGDDGDNGDDADNGL